MILTKSKVRKRRKLISLPKLLKKAEKVMNSYVRKRDSEDGYFTCISCGKIKPVEVMDAGHYVPVGSCSFLRLNEFNIHGECKGCNGFDSFHLIGYKKNLIDKIGPDMVKWLEDNRHTPAKHCRQDLEEIIIKYS